MCSDVQWFADHLVQNQIFNSDLDSNSDVYIFRFGFCFSLSLSLSLSLSQKISNLNPYLSSQPASQPWTWTWCMDEHVWGMGHNGAKRDRRRRPERVRGGKRKKSAQKKVPEKGFFFIACAISTFPMSWKVKCGVVEYSIV
jgi:hypothetical protein